MLGVEAVSDLKFGQRRANDPLRVDSAGSRLPQRCPSRRPFPFRFVAPLARTGNLPR